MNKKYDLICVGIANVSLSVKPVSRDIFGTDVTLIDPIEVCTGGDAMNEALTASRLGLRTCLVSKIGDDLFGRILLETTREAGVATEHLVVSKTARTAAAALLIDKAGDRNILAHRGAFEDLRPEDLDMTLFEEGRIVNIGSLFSLKMLDGDGVKTVLERAKAAGAITGADMKFDTYRKGFDGIKQVFPFLDYFYPNFDEALYLTGERDPARQADALFKAGCGTVVIKLGKDGCFLATREAKKTIPPCPARRVDTSGAGDNFVAGFLTALSLGWAAEAAARFGNGTAAVSIQEVGSNGAVRSFEQVKEHMKQAGYPL